MKSSDLKVGKGYAHYQARLSEGQRPYYTPVCAIPLDTKVWHSYRDENRNLVFKQGRKALGYGKDWYVGDGTPYIEGCGVPCMVANNAGLINSNTRWVFRMIDPRYFWDEDWSYWENLDKERRAKAEAERQERERVAEALRAAYERAVQALIAVQGNYGVNAYGSKGIMFSTAGQLDFIASLCESYLELQEEVKDLRYELED